MIDARLVMLERELREEGLPTRARQDVVVALLEGYPLTRVERLFDGLPDRLYIATFDRMRERLIAAADNAERRAGVRLMVRFVDGAADLLTRAQLARAVSAIAPVGEPSALSLLAHCAADAHDAVAVEAWRGLLRIPIDLAELRAHLDDLTVLRGARALPALVADEPALVGPLFASLFAEVESAWPALRAPYHDALGRAAARARRTETFGDAVWRPFLPALRAAVANDDEDGAVRVAAIEALGELGGIDELAMLRPLTDGLFRAGRIKEAARRALTAIRVRENVREEVGALALVEGDQGGLALHED